MYNSNGAKHNIHTRTHSRYKYDTLNLRDINFPRITTNVPQKSATKKNGVKHRQTHDKASNVKLLEEKKKPNPLVQEHMELHLSVSLLTHLLATKR